MGSVPVRRRDTLCRERRRGSRQIRRLERLERSTSADAGQLPDLREFLYLRRQLRAVHSRRDVHGEISGTFVRALRTVVADGMQCPELDVSLWAVVLRLC